MIGSASCTRPLHQALIPLAVSVPPAALFISGKAGRIEMEEELDTQPALERQRPPSIDYVFEVTNFSRREIQRLYRAFKELWPNGTVALEQFQALYASIFPKGDANDYAELVFRNMDQGQVGSVTFLNLNIANGGRITRAEFLQRCQSNPEIMNSLELFGSFHNGLLNL
ncbi:hypothetical protein CAEBREN_22691 [Caenorhabditis brenneri]|uniref:EF-hand domain-containing protein n=1 Tax=Caenorhabditis brenneri TaxID=135651 RepID=G0MIC7_CAEBE|nr:hypothetical protein CAEBREN_22691 [Caenorhabditis brenneri]